MVAILRVLHTEFHSTCHLQPAEFADGQPDEQRKQEGNEGGHAQVISDQLHVRVVEQRLVAILLIFRTEFHSTSSSCLVDDGEERREHGQTEDDRCPQHIPR